LMLSQGSGYPHEQEPVSAIQGAEIVS